MDALMLLVSIALLAYLQSLLVRHFGMRKLAYKRCFSRHSAHEGDTVEMVEVIRNQKILPVPFLRAESRLSPSLAFQSDTEDHITENRYHKSVFSLRPYCQITRRHTVQLKKRGYYPSGTISITAGDLMGIASPTLQVESGAAIQVYPRLLDPDHMPSPASKWLGDMLVKRWILPDPAWTGGIRPYAQGDPMQSIHWPATARAGALQVKVHDPTSDAKLMVVINAQMSEHQWADLMEYEQQTAEHMISMAATVCIDALQNGLEAGFAINTPMDKGSDATIYPPARYAGREDELLSAMAHLTLQRTQTFPSLLEKLATYNGMDILILSVYDSELVRQRMEALRLRGNSVTLQLIDKAAAMPEVEHGH